MKTLSPIPTSTPLCRLIWRQNKLWVLPAETSKPHLALPALAQPEWFKACLERSKAKAVVIDPSLGSEVVTFWAEACEQVKKPLFLRLPAMVSLPEKKRVWAWRAKCAFERGLGLGLLLLVSPLMLIFAALLKLQDGGSALVYYWCIGQRGRVFKLAQFRREHRVTQQKTKLGYFLELTRLDRLPRLLNVFRGEMTLVGTKAWSIEEALRFPEEYRTCLKALPGIVGPRPFSSFISAQNFIQVIQDEVAYVKDWSLKRDGKTLLGLFSLKFR
jgi:lipopolysaccharide/colanic/teichoic acid biosynthesis glycosyltransferase